MAGKVLEVGYAAFPSVKLYKVVTNPETGEKSLKFNNELIYGDRIVPSILKSTGDYSRVEVGGKQYIRVTSRRSYG
ncbi:MAG: hypothetical protein II479_03715, partial [Bacteroidales bacterium]|nr:hypothetical protein [Bacteroidales bacterium]